MTYAPATIRDLAAYWISQGGVNSGIVGSWSSHGRGYHLGRDRIFSDCAYKPAGACSPGLYSRDYSVQLARDKAGLSDAASAIDLGRLGGSLPNLFKFSVWLVERCLAGAPYTQDIREVIYTPNGKLPIHRYSGEDKKIYTGPGSGDDSHLWHTHISFYRDSEQRAKVPLFAPYFAPPIGDTVNKFAVPKVPQEMFVATGTWLYDNSAFASSNANIKIDPGRWMPYVGLVESGVWAVQYVNSQGVPSGAAYFVKAAGTVRDVPTGGDDGINQDTVDAAVAKALAEAAELCQKSTEMAVDAAIAATKAKAKVVVSFD